MVIKDIAPELLEKIREDFKGRLLADKTLQALMERVESGKADYNTAYEIAIIISKHLSKAYKGNITADILPESKMYYNIADRTIRPTLIELHEKVSEASAQIQTSLNQAANIGIKGLKADLSTDRIDGIINKLTSYESYNKGEWILGETIITYGQAIVDDTIRANAGFHFKLGMSAKIERTSMGKCCSWCDKLVGTYEYPNVPKDVYRRHKHCRCRVLFNSGGKKRQDVWTKKWVDTENKFDKAIVKFKRGATLN